MTWAEYQETHPFLTRAALESGAVQVFSRDPQLWRLTDWAVSSAVSGPSVILVPRARVTTGEAEANARLNALVAALRDIISTESAEWCRQKARAALALALAEEGE